MDDVAVVAFHALAASIAMTKFKELARVNRELLVTKNASNTDI